MRLWSPLKKIKDFVNQWHSFLAMGSHFLPHIKKQSRVLVLSLLAGSGFTLVGMLEPWPLKMIFDNVFSSEPLPGWLSFLPSDPFALLNVLILAIILIAVIRGLFYYYQQLLTSRAGQQIVTGVRLDLYSHLQGLSFSFHDRRRTGDMLSRLTTDIRMLRELLISLPLTFTSELLLMVAMLMVMALMDWKLTLLSLCVFPLLMILIKKYRHPMKLAMKQQREREGNLTTIATEVLGAIKVVQGFHQEESEVGRFGSQNKDSLRSGLKATRLEAKLKWASDLSVALVTALVLGVAGRRVLFGDLSPGDLLVFAFYLRTFNRPLRRLSKITEQMARGTASGERILELLHIEPEIRDLPYAKRAKKFCGDIRFEDVSLHYFHKKPVLNNISLTIRAGEKVALVGPTGSGKSSLASLLPRFYEPSAGQVLIDGQEIKNYTIKSLRSQIAVVFQEPILFATTIAENIAYGRPGATIDEIVNAAKRAKIHSIIEGLPEGYDTVIGERGGTLSGGQRQCVSIARALIKDAPIVILDEPTSGVDMPSAILVMEAIKELMQGRTILLISHQEQTLQDVDRVIKLRKGEIVDDSSFAWGG